MFAALGRVTGILCCGGRAEALAGDIPFHCHLVDHEDNGMMGVLRVTPQGGAGPAGNALETATHAHTPQDMNGMH
jgi:hypothetical protein